MSLKFLVRFNHLQQKYRTLVGLAASKPLYAFLGGFWLWQSAAFCQSQPNIIPPSPGAAALAEYAEHPVSAYTGLPSISVPVYTINYKEITLPIALNYHAGGIKVEEEASMVGLGWSLSAGGAITRSVRGVDDLYKEVGGPYGYVYSGDLYDMHNLTASQANALCGGLYDSQPDLFFFNVMGKSGKFTLKPKVNSGDPIEVILYSDEKMSISYDETAKEWLIWTADGYALVFAQKEYTKTLSGSSGSISEATYNLEQSQYNPDIKEIVTAWYLTKIISPAGNGITFEYDHNPETQVSSFVSKSTISISESRELFVEFFDPNDLQAVGNGQSNTPQQPDCNNVPRRYSLSQQIVKHTYLKKIFFGPSRLEFFHSDRDDMAAWSTNTRPQKLDRIDLVEDTQAVRTYTFAYDYFNPTALPQESRRRLKLLSLQESSSGISKPPYVFDYNEEIHLPRKDSYAKDLFGYYNGVNSNLTQIPTFKYLNTNNQLYIINGGDVTTNEEYSKAAVLEKITYPTGGSTSFFYESNTFNKDEVDGQMADPSLVYEEKTVSFDESAPKIIVLREGTFLDINVDLKCRALACYPGGSTGPECTEFNDLDPYFSIDKLGSGARVFSAVFSDYHCKLNNVSCDFISIVGADGAECGIKKTRRIYLAAGTYKLSPYSNSDFYVSGIVTFVQPKKVLDQDDFLIVKGGGLRLWKSVVSSPGAKDIIKKYDYHYRDYNGFLRSRGKLMSLPAFAFFSVRDDWDFNLGGPSQCINLVLQSSSTVPLSTSAGGGFVGYGEVKEIFGEKGENGYQVTKFHNLPDTKQSNFIPGLPGTAHPQNGLPEKILVYNRDGILLSEKSMTYVKHSSSTLNERLYFYSPQCGEVYLFFGYYNEPNEWWIKTSEYEEIYDDTGTLKLRKDYEYFYENATHKQLTRSSFKDSEGNFISTYYTYPMNGEGLSAPAEMWDPTNQNYKHMHSAVLRKRIQRGGVDVLIEDNVYEYNAAEDFVALASQKVALDGQSFVDNFTVEKYDDRGNILQVKDRSGIVTSYLWGYAERYPVARFVNATYDHAVSFFSGQDLANIQNGLISSDQLRQKVLDVYDDLPEAHITIYTYQSNVGQTSITDPNGLTTHYSYDDLGRLLEVKDPDLHLVMRYKYNYQQATTN